MPHCDLYGAKTHYDSCRDDSRLDPAPSHVVAALERSLDGHAGQRDDPQMRRLVAALLIGIALVGAIYLGSLRLGRSGWISIQLNCGLGAPAKSCSDQPLPIVPRDRAAWQVPVAILIGVLGIAGALMVLRTRPKPPVGSSTQTA